MHSRCARLAKYTRPGSAAGANPLFFHIAYCATQGRQSFSAINDMRLLASAAGATAGIQSGKSFQRNSTYSHNK
jgi:hypothetical protein